VFLDLSADGVLEAGDPGLAGRLVYLDVNNTGQFAPGDPSALTDASGAFTLQGVPAGTYTLRVQTFPGEIATGKGSLHIVLVGGGVTQTGANLGLQPGSSVAPVLVSPAPFGSNPDPNVAAVEGLYHLVLNRTGSAGEVAAWVQQLDAGLSLGSITSLFLHSAEHESQVVQSYYQNFLGRSASPGEVNGFVALFQAGWSEPQVAQVFLDSAEYSAAHASNDAFVRALYHDVLGRTPGNAEVAGWVQYLQGGGSRQTVVSDFVNSAETDQRAIASDYEAYLGRQASAGEVNGWLGAVQQGAVSLTDVAAAILGSTEFANRAARGVN
jgi:hypothetical protein